MMLSRISLRMRCAAWPSWLVGMRHGAIDGAVRFGGDDLGREQLRADRWHD